MLQQASRARKLVFMLGAVVATLTWAASAPLAWTAPAPACHLRGALPDPSCTPGALNPEVTQETIHQTICVPGYSRRIRPPASYTNELKRRQMQLYGLKGSPSDYEEDHLIPLSLGGSPTDSRNLWPEPRRGPKGQRAEDKDVVELTLYQRVCDGATPLVTAQRAIATDWTTALEATGSAEAHLQPTI